MIVVHSITKMLDRVFGILRAKNPEIESGQRKFIMVPPIVSRESKKISIDNFNAICRRYDAAPLHRSSLVFRMGRPQDHFMQFLLAELGTTGNLGGVATDSADKVPTRLIVKGKFQAKQIEKIIRGYFGTQ